MIKHRLFFLFVFCFYFSASITAQEIKWAVHANGGISQIVFLDLDRKSILFKEINLNNQSKVTWNYGSSFAISIGDGLALETGLSVLGINGKFTYKQSNTINPNRPFKVRNNAETYYLGIPVKINIDLNNFVFTSGFQTLLFIKGEYTNHSPESIGNNGNPLYLEERESFNFRRFDLGLALGFKYKINDSFSLNTDCYWGLSNMFANPSPSGTGFSRRNRYLTLGLSYYLKNYPNS